MGTGWAGGGCSLGWRSNKNTRVLGKASIVCNWDHFGIDYGEVRWTTLGWRSRNTGREGLDGSANPLCALWPTPAQPEDIQLLPRYLSQKHWKDLHNLYILKAILRYCIFEIKIIWAKCNDENCHCSISTISRIILNNFGCLGCEGFPMTWWFSRDSKNFGRRPYVSHPWLTFVRNLLSPWDIQSIPLPQVLVSHFVSCEILSMDNW